MVRGRYSLTLEQYIAKFESRIIIREDGCYEYQGGVDIYNGYGIFYCFNEKHIAHRWYYKVKVGLKDESNCVLHKCDYRLCVNLDHLFEGTRQDNIADMDGKGRRAIGSNGPNSKLTERDVAEIKSLMYTTPATILGSKYGVDASTIGRIKLGKTWTHV